MGNPSGGCTVEGDYIDLIQPLDLSVLRIHSGDVVVVKSSHYDDGETTARAVMLRKLFEEQGITDTLILVLSEGTSIEALPDEEMLKLGWVRA